MALILCYFTEFVYDDVVKSICSLFHLLMSSLYTTGGVLEEAINVSLFVEEALTILIFLVELLRTKLGTRKLAYFPLHRTSASEQIKHLWIA